MQGYNPFGKWKLGFKPLNATPGLPGGGQLTPANSKISGPDETLDQDGNQRMSLRRSIGTSVDLPANLYAPPGSQSLELSTAFSVPAFTITPIPVLTFRCPLGMAGQILGYAFTSTAPGLVFFSPTVNGFRVFPFNGDPVSNFILDTPTGPDLTTPVPVQLTLKPGDVFQWLIQNADAAAHAVSVRTTGYLISSIRQEDTRFGG